MAVPPMKFVANDVPGLAYKTIPGSKARVVSSLWTTLRLQVQKSLQGEILSTVLGLSIGAIVSSIEARLFQ